MSGERRRRRLRIRRKRKDESLASKILESEDVVEVVGRVGCCLIEAVGSAAVLAALLTVPAYLLTR